MMLEWDGGHRDIAWHSTHVIRLYQEGDDFSIWLARDEATSRVLWRYINLEAPWERTLLGFDSKDLWLDLYSESEDDDWHWKDEDELARLVERGEVDAAFAAEVRRSGEQAVARIGAGATLLDPSWVAWRPDPSWATPTLPEHWWEYDEGV